MSAHADRDQLLVVVVDTGSGLVQRDDSPALGLGLPIIAGVAGRFEIDAGGDGRGTELRMWFTLRRRRARRPAELREERLEALLRRGPG